VPGRIYQQNHVGTYRSDDYGDSWYRIDKGLPSDYGFGLALHTGNPESCYVTPLSAGDYSFRATTGKFRVFQYNGNGRGWNSLGKGLPHTAYINVLREGMSSDTLKPCGVYVGTKNGSVFHSSDEGRTWRTMAQYLPEVLSVSVSVF
jgi:hypothetical protein